MITRSIDRPRREIFRSGWTAPTASRYASEVSTSSRMASRMLVFACGEEKMTPSAPRRQIIQIIEKRMARHLFLVSRHEGRLYEYLVERFRDDENVEMILDRRRGERR